MSDNPRYRRGRGRRPGFRPPQHDSGNRDDWMRSRMGSKYQGTRFLSSDEPPRRRDDHREREDRPFRRIGGNRRGGLGGRGDRMITRPQEEYREEDLFCRDHRPQEINPDFYEHCQPQKTTDPSTTIPEEIPTIEGLEEVAHPLIRQNISRCQFTVLTPVQRHALPIIMDGHDLMCSAPTGSGKTFAFLIPLINNTLKGEWACAEGAREIDRRGGGSGRHPDEPYRPPSQYVAKPKILVISPTRELSAQIYHEALKFTFIPRKDRSPGRYLRSCVVYGGVPMDRQISDLEQGCDVLICCAGRLIDLMNQGIVSLEDLHAVVLDEADRQLDLGFQPQIDIIFQHIDATARLPVRCTGEHDRGIQVLMFSATFPTVVQRLASRLLNPKYVFVSIGRVGHALKNIRQRIQWVEEARKADALMDLISLYFEQSEEPKTVSESSGARVDDWRAKPTEVKVETGEEVKVVVFAETKRSVDNLYHWIREQGYFALRIHGDRSQADREEAMDGFRSRRQAVMIATDVFSRGLDVPNITHVINYDMPSDIDTYLHRIGRSGRMGASGLATSFVNDRDRRLFDELREQLERSENEIPEWFRADQGRSGGRPRRSGAGQGPARDFRRGGGHGESGFSSYAERFSSW